MYTVEQITKAGADANISEYWMKELCLSLIELYGSEPQQLLQQTPCKANVCLHDGKINSGHHADQPCWCDLCGEEL